MSSIWTRSLAGSVAPGRVANGSVVKLLTEDAMLVAHTSPVPSTATNEPFYPTGTSGQLQIGGVDVVSGASITNIIRTDWQGAVPLSPYPRTNRVLQSQDLTQAAWSKNGGMTVTTGFTSPDGGSTCSRIIAGTVNEQHFVYQSSVPLMPLAIHTMTLYIDKASTNPWCWIFGQGDLTGAGYALIWFNASTGTSPTGSRVGFTSVTITDTGTGFWKLVLVLPVTTSVATPYLNIQIAPTSGDTAYAYAGDGVSYVGVDKIQVELGPTCGLYIPTTTTTATVTDYSWTSSGVVTLGQTASGTYVWNGSGILAAVAGAALSGTAACASLVSGSLTTAISLAGTASSVVSTSGTVTTAIRFSGAANSQVTASGALTTAITFFGSAQAASAASGSLTTTITLAGTAASVTTVSGALEVTGGAALSGLAACAASVTGTISTAIALSGLAQGQATGAGSITTSIRFSGSAAATSTVSGSLTTAISLSGLAACSATLTGSLASDAAAFFGMAAVTCTLVGTLSTAETLNWLDQSKDGGGGSHWRKKPTAGAGLRVPYQHDKPVDEFGYEIYEPSAPATPLPEVASAPMRVTIATGPTELDLAIAPPYREPVVESLVLKTLQVQLDGIKSTEALKVKQNNHALRLLLLAS